MVGGLGDRSYSFGRHDTSSTLSPVLAWKFAFWSDEANSVMSGVVVHNSEGEVGDLRVGGGDTTRGTITGAAGAGAGSEE